MFDVSRCLDLLDCLLAFSPSCQPSVEKALAFLLFLFAV
jgi:hypothetical protein